MDKCLATFKPEAVAPFFVFNPLGLSGAALMLVLISHQHVIGSQTQTVYGGPSVGAPGVKSLFFLLNYYRAVFW